MKPVKINHHVGLEDKTSLRVGGPAETLIELGADDNLAEAVEQYIGQPIYVLGYGTNCLISDQGLPLVIIDKHGVIDKLNDTDYRVESGVNWDDFVQRTIADELWGLEFASGIPGGVGAAVVGNIAAYGHKVADCLLEAKLLNSQTGNVQTWPASRLELDYRTSALQRTDNKKLIVLEATFSLKTEPANQLEYDSALKTAAEMGVEPDSLKNRRQIIMETRRRAGSLLTPQTGEHHSAGSFFKNPLVSSEQVEKILSFEEHGISRDQLLHQNLLHGGQTTRVSAAHVLLAAGFSRGQSWGQVRLHPDHILKIENLGQATAKEIYDVVQLIVATVQDKLNITLEPEVQMLGDF